MKYILFAIAAVILWQIKRMIFQKIDEDEERARKTPGRANYIRTNFPGVVEYLQNIPNYVIIFERRDMVQIGYESETEYFVLGQDIGKLTVAFIKNGMVIKEWKFSPSTNASSIIQTLRSNR